MLDRRRLLQSAALGAGLAAVGGSALARIQTAAPVEGGPVDATFRGFMDRAFEETLDRAPEVVTMFGLDKGARAAAKSQLTAPTRQEEDDQRAFVRRQAAELARVRPKATHDAGVWRLPKGDAYYAYALNFATTTEMSAEAIHQLGLERMTELTARADELLKAQGMTQGSVADRIKALGDDPKYIYPNTDAGKAELIAKLNAQMADMQARLPSAFGRLPKAKVEIKRVPPEIEAGAPMGYYNSASLDGTRPGIYWINLKDTAEWPSWSLPTLTYHEATPGHHLQISLQQESPSAPLLMNLLGFSSYVEGWGLYAEQLADELGAYENDPVGQIGYIQSLMFRAARLVVDTGIHSKGWSREQGIRYMMDAYGDQEGAATSEVERYCGWPGQACAYKVGHNEWVRLREQAKTTLGPKFDIKGFHDTALAAGGVPLSVLERIVQDWTSTQA